MLKLSNNSKTKFYGTHKNTFGLLHGLPKNGGTCVGAAYGKGGCLDTRDGLKRKTCYVEKITQIYKAVGNILLSNTELLVGKTKEEMTIELRNMVTAFIKKSKPEQLFFRLHWSGDFFSTEYAEAWASIINEFTNVKFWVYTRSFRKQENYILPLIGLKNLSLYLSCDPVNYADAKEVYDKYKESAKNLGLAWLGDNPPSDYKFITCPETSGHIKNLPEKGACAKCRLCVDNYKDRIKNIRFLIH